MVVPELALIVLIGAVAWTATLHCLSFFFGWGLRFEFNHLDECAYETADVGAFYTCGQQATCLVNPGNILRSSTFTNIHNLGPLGVQQNEVDAVYLDDMMSSWTITNNTFINCSSGVGAAVFVGGGRLNAITGNHFESCPTAIHFDSRGTGHHKGPGGPPKYVLSRSSPPRLSDGPASATRGGDRHLLCPGVVPQFSNDRRDMFAGIIFSGPPVSFSGTRVLDQGATAPASRGMATATARPPHLSTSSLDRPVSAGPRSSRRWRRRCTTRSVSTTRGRATAVRILVVSCSRHR